MDQLHIEFTLSMQAFDFLQLVDLIKQSGNQDLIDYLEQFEEVKKDQLSEFLK